MFGGIIFGRGPSCVTFGARLLGVVWAAAATACLAGQPQVTQLSAHGDPLAFAPLYDFPERYDIAAGGSGSSTPYPATPLHRSGHATPWNQVPPSPDAPGTLAGETFRESRDGRPYLRSDSVSYLDRLPISDPPVRLPTELATLKTYFQPSAIGSREDPWTLQLLPDGLIYRSYLAGAKESRIGCTVVHERRVGWIWDIALGGRVGVLRWGSEDTVRPEGWQIDLEGAGLPRLDFENHRELTSVDFRFGVPLTYGRGRYQTKFAYYHLSSHLGDEFMVRNATLTRRNYARDVLVWGHSFFLTDDVRLYAEAGWAFFALDGSEPWEFQFGIDYSPVRPHSPRGTPFFAINGHLREELDFGGNLVVQTGWQWRGDSDHLFRLGMQYFSGMSDQFEFYDQFEDKLGVGIWYDY